MRLASDQRCRPRRLSWLNATSVDRGWQVRWRTRSMSPLGDLPMPRWRATRAIPWLSGLPDPHRGHNGRSSGRRSAVALAACSWGRAGSAPARARDASAGALSWTWIVLLSAEPRPGNLTGRRRAGVSVGPPGPPSPLPPVGLTAAPRPRVAPWRACAPGVLRAVSTAPSRRPQPRG